MGRAIVKQPNDKYAVFSSVIDDFIYVNCTKEELIEHLAEDVATNSRRETGRRLENLAMESAFTTPKMHGSTI